MSTQTTPSVRTIAGIVLVFSLLPGTGSSARAATTPAETTALPIPVVTRFENFGEKDGLPSHKVHSVLKPRTANCGSEPTTGCACANRKASSTATEQRMG